MRGGKKKEMPSRMENGPVGVLSFQCNALGHSAENG